MRPQDKERITVEVTRRILEREIETAAQSREAYLDNLIHEVLYFEDRRLESMKSVPEADRRFLSGIRNRFHNASEQDKKDILEAIIRWHAGEVVGHFSPTTYNLSTIFLPSAMGVLLNGMSPLKLAKTFPRLPSVSENIVVRGEVDQVRALDRLGTIILVPTHSSNLDSIAIGYAIYKLGLPPYTYGAGLNLFRSKVLGFFMHRLGAYKVDRLKKHRLYKDVLKEYATITLEFGYDNLFFPGGTRSRSGAVEQKLKLGLLGCGLSAYYNNLRRRTRMPKIFIVPATINYQITLEAETLIEDHLKDVGKQRYIIEDDEFSQFERLFTFTRSLVTLDADIVINIGKALDPFGNRVDMNGRSLDGRGRPIEIDRYLYRNGELTPDPDRDAQYCRELGRKVVDAFMEDSIIFSTHVLAWTVFRMLRKKHPDPDFYRFLRQSGYESSLPMVDVYRAVERNLVHLREFAQVGRFRLAKTPAGEGAEEVVDRALRLFGCYHKRPVLERRGDRLFPVDMNLLYYYRNRLWGYGLDAAD